MKYRTLAVGFSVLAITLAPVSAFAQASLTPDAAGADQIQQQAPPPQQSSGDQQTDPIVSGSGNSVLRQENAGQNLTVSGAPATTATPDPDPNPLAWLLLGAALLGLLIGPAAAYARRVYLETPTVTDEAAPTKETKAKDTKAQAATPAETKAKDTKAQAATPAETKATTAKKKPKKKTPANKSKRRKKKK